MKALLVALALALAACGASLGDVRRDDATRAAVPDAHGDPLALLPADPVLAVRLDAAQLRASPHWPALAQLLDHEIHDTLAQLSHELGIDLLARGDRLGLALYEPLRESATQGTWPALVVNGGVDEQEIRTQLVARVTAAGLETRTDGVLTYTLAGPRAYAFPAHDVMLVFEPRLAHAIARRLAGSDRADASHDATFDPLWQQAGGRGGALQARAEASRLRALVGENPLAHGVVRSVLRADADEDLHAHLVALMDRPSSANELAQQLETMRRRLLARFEVRLLGMGRLLNQGITAVADGDVVRVNVEARSNEVRQLLRAADILARFVR